MIDGYLKPFKRLPLYNCLCSLQFTVNLHGCELWNFKSLSYYIINHITVTGQRGTHHPLQSHFVNNSIGYFRIKNIYVGSASPTGTLDPPVIKFTFLFPQHPHVYLTRIAFHIPGLPCRGGSALPGGLPYREGGLPCQGGLLARGWYPSMH